LFPLFFPVLDSVVELVTHDDRDAAKKSTFYRRCVIPTELAAMRFECKITDAFEVDLVDYH
jgi:hypothetical protein